MKTIILAVYFTLASLYSNPALTDFKDWEQQDKRLWKSYITLNVIDTFQTFDLINKQKDRTYQYRHDLKETNPILGSHPKKGELVILKLVTNTLAYKVLDNNPEARTITLALMNGIYIKTVANNHEVGLRLTYQFK